ncbi:hypothetical protein DXG03_001762 [Asterophora parasitica]|uniref:SHSP domain-containing protein n=1 Tax=Asterophora parasitica TaxID=117018 RepID=A0A9P7G534_9AGAR|nr:hypothetical protein DXG03_001762 [Asterophora parasitica]
MCYSAPRTHAMPAYAANGPSVLNSRRDRDPLTIPTAHLHPDRTSNLSPVTPAVTGIIYPSTPLDSITEADTSIYRAAPNKLYTHPNLAASAIERDSHSSHDFSNHNHNGTRANVNGGFQGGSAAPRPLSENHSGSLDQLWGTIRQQKELKMAKERPKVQSLEEITAELSPEQDGRQYRASEEHYRSPDPYMNGYGHDDIPVLEHHGQYMTGGSGGKSSKSIKKQKSISSIRESTDGRSLVVTFDLPDVAKQDVHVSFQRTRLIVTWATAELTEWDEFQEDADEPGVTRTVVMRERTEKIHHRTLPLPEGTKFEEIRGLMNGRTLTLRYPNMRCVRAEPRSRSGGS